MSAPAAKARIALVAFSSLGDGLIYLMMAENLRLNGFAVTYFGNIGYQLRAWLPQFEIGPGLRTAVGTELGLFDYSLALELGRQGILLRQLVSRHQTVSETDKLQGLGGGNPWTGQDRQQDHGEMKELSFKSHGAFPRLLGMPQCGEASSFQI